MTLTIIERAIATFAIADDEWALLAPFMPTKKHNTGSETDWRSTVDALIVKWNLPNCAWRKIPSASRIRMAWHRSVEYGTWAEIERALPSLGLSRASMFKKICFAAGKAKVVRR
jgi:hypothetical protein